MIHKNGEEGDSCYRSYAKQAMLTQSSARKSERQR